MSHLTFRQKIGQLFIVGFSGESISPDHPVIKDIHDKGLGGVIIFDRLLARSQRYNNIINELQLTKLTKSLQELNDIPLLISVDQEGGKVSRFAKERGFAESPSAQELGKQSDVEKTSYYGRQTAQLLKNLGVNLNLAPVIDLNIYPENPIIGKHGRSFSENASTVTAHATAWIEQHRQINILTCLKHFPGHGSSRNDSHLGFVDITDTWQLNELSPFHQLIEQKMADGVMLGHLFNRNLDKKYPASLSKKTVENLLHKNMQYYGPILSDDMQMKAITDHYGVEEACCLAINAGVDIVIVGNNLDHNPHIFTSLVDAVEKAIEAGQIQESRIEESFIKIQKLKQQLIN